MILEYLYLEYSRTKWAYFNLNRVRYKFGGEEKCRKELNDLFHEGKIKRVDGINGYLIQLLTDIEGKEIIMP